MEIELPKKVVLKDNIVYNVVKWEPNRSLINEVEFNNVERLTDSFGVQYYYWTKDSHGHEYTRVGFIFPVKVNGKLVYTVNLKYAECMYILTSECGQYTMPISEKELTDKYISVNNLEEYLQNKRFKFLLENCIDSNYIKILEDATKVWGKEAQMLVMAEECSELTQAILKIVNRKNTNTDNLIEELADVIIMINQMLHLFGTDQVKKVIEVKMEKIKAKIGKSTSV